MSHIESVFESKSKENAEAGKYLQQWHVAKTHVPQLLNTISHYFPHYSLHDSTHSETILNNIELIMGAEVIDKLSIVDLWLLLSASYYHDLGMVITRDDKLECLKEGSAFINYVRSKQNDETSPMHNYALCFEIKDNKLFHKNNEITPENIDAQKFLFADYIRQEHADRATARIQHEGSMHLPGSSIPERIIRILGNICKAHGQKQKDLLELAQEENSGCGTEKCHPLFVACMLRLGDLLDVDTNRVSKVLLSSLTSIPSDSLLYNQTNRDITHINIGRKLIEISAECEDIKVANLLNDWFKMIDVELQFQSRNWYKIAPSIDFGSLPSAGKLIVRLKGYDDISGKNRPRFEINSLKAIEMLQGAGLYNDASQSIRELLQNAVDATYIRVFMENPTLSDRSEFRKKCAEHVINVELNKLAVEVNRVKWHLKIQDQGVGIAPDEVIYLIRTGSSSQNQKKNDICKKMPSWMRPSGAFGIGFQSIFLITDKVTLVTRKWGTDDVVKLEMWNPSGNEKGNILQKTYKDEFTNFGTIIDCDLYFDMHSGWTVHSNEKVSLETIGNFDFAVDESLDIQAAKLIDEINKFAEQTNVGIHFKMNNKEYDFAVKEEDAYDYYDEETGYEVRIGSQYRKTALYYRNQYVEKFNSNIELLNFSVNILSGKATELLELSRNNVLKEKKEEISENVLKAVLRYLISKYELLDKEIKDPITKLKPLAAAILEENREYIETHNIETNGSLPNDWMSLDFWGKYAGVDEKKSIGQLFQFGRAEFWNNANSELRFYNKKNKKSPFVISQNGLNTQPECFDFLKFVLGRHLTNLVYTSECIVLSKDSDKELIADTKEAKLRWFKNYLNGGTYARGYMPCLKKYSSLRLKDISHESTFRNFGATYPVMICPYVKTSTEILSVFFTHRSLEFRADEKVVDYIYNHRYSEEISREQIKDKLKEFQEEFQPIVDEINSSINKKR